MGEESGDPATRPRTWHYGVVAKYWAEFNNAGPEIDYFRQFVEGDGQPALDVACGTGRLLVPYLQAGLDVDGCDISTDMLALCRERAEREGLSANLYAQAIHELDLPRRYQTVFVCGGFGLGGSREQDLEGLRRLYRHLEPGGRLVLDHEVPYAYSADWPYWLKEERGGLPRSWKAPAERKRAPDGAEYSLRSRLVALDPLSQSVTYELRAEMWRDDKLVAEEEHLLKMTMYFRNEVLLMLERTGFADVAVRGGYTDAEPTGEDDFLVFVAHK